MLMLDTKWKLSWQLHWILNVLSKPEFCDPEIYKELIRTPTMKQKMVKLGLVDSKPKRKKGGK